jgi:acyl-CoA synthetase (AMP-forming)/AMP-acid ligase II
MTGNLHCGRLDEVVTAWARGHAEAIVATLGSERITYRELDVCVRRLAGALLAVGIQRGDRVAALQTAHPEYLTTLLAVSSIGAIWVGLNPKYQMAELLGLTQDCRPRILITRSRALGRDYSVEIATLRQSVDSLEHVVIFDGDPLLPETNSLAHFTATHRADAAALARAQAAVLPKDPCVLVYTSGSTGTPKGALLSHAGILNFARLQNEIWPVKPLRTLNFLPINHVGSVVDVSMPVLMAGGTLFFMEAFSAAESVKVTQREQLTWVASVPSAFQMQMETPEFSTVNWSAAQLLVWEGAAMPADRIQALMRFPCPFATNYNMTEASAITVLEPTRDFELLSSTVGSPYPGVSIRLLTNDGLEANRSEAGEVWVKSDMNFLGYWNRPEATAAAFSADGYFRTGDIAIRRPDGRYKLVGRVKEMFKSGGYNVYPREVEAAIEEHPAVATAVVVPVPDPRWQEVGVAFVVPKPDMNIEGLEDWVRQRLANYKRPKRYVIQNALPLVPIGKVDRAALKLLASGQQK